MSEIGYLEGYTTAVSIKDLCKSYHSVGSGKELVLNKFCMQVQKGSIYGFLGASGCGKTTVLSCIVGLRKWDSGQIFVFGNKLRSNESGISGQILGYMPQDLALHNQLSIMETVKFYGRLYSLPTSIIMKQWKVLSELLDLSNEGSKLIGKLSGGQKRRASLAMAMIHSPQLLILDEPTVGLDPVLRENIWKYLYHIAGKLGTTIIITTHYIEEARYSDMIGLMRRGRMLVESSPSQLMKMYETDLLEQVVMKVCRLDETKTARKSEKGEELELQQKQSAKLTFKSSWKLKSDLIFQNNELEGQIRVLEPGDIGRGYHGNQDLKKIPESKYSNFIRSLQRTFGLTWVICLIFFRFPALLISIVTIPAMQVTITLWVVGSKPLDLPLGIINNEVRNWKTACESIRNDGYNESKLISGCQLTSDMELKILSCQYLSQLEKDKLVDLREFTSEEEARVQVEMGNSWGYMIIPSNFSQSFGDLLLAKQYAMNESIEGSRIQTYLDYSQYISRAFIIRSMYTSYLKFLKDVAVSCSFDEKMVDIPLNFRKPIYGDTEDNYTAFAMPGLLLCCMFSMVSSVPGLLLITDHRQGTLSRATVAGLSFCNVITSHMIIQGVFIIAQLVTWNIVLYFLFSIHFNGQVWLYILICLLTGLSGTTLGILWGIVMSTEVVHLLTIAFISTVISMYGGIVWPTEAMNKFWQTAATFLPTNLPIQSLRSVIVRGVGIGHPLVWPGILASVIWTTVLVILSTVLYRRKT